MLKALGSIPSVLTKKPKLLDLCLEPVSEQVFVRTLGAVAAEGPQILTKDLTIAVGLATAHTTKLYVCCEDVPIE